MAKAFSTPITNEEGDVRDLTDEEWLWAVSGTDNGGFEGTMDFLKARQKFLTAAEDAGFDRAFFLAFQPSKPGFVERAVAALDSVLKKVRHAAE